MEEYWNQFLNWLNNVGQLYNNYINYRNAVADEDYIKKLMLYPRAPKAEDRYANSIYNEGWKLGYPTEEILLKEERKSIFDRSDGGAQIYRYIKNPGDTVYVEQSPVYDVLGGFLTTRSAREASTKRPRGNEYQVLKRRWNTAKKLAKK